ALADREIGLPYRHASFRDRRPIGNAARAIGNEFLIVELHSIGRRMLDPVPQRTKLLAVEYLLANGHRLTLVGVLNFKTACDLSQKPRDGREVWFKAGWQCKGPGLDGGLQAILHFAVAVDKVQ